MTVDDEGVDQTLLATHLDEDGRGASPLLSLTRGAAPRPSATPPSTSAVNQRNPAAHPGHRTALQPPCESERAAQARRPDPAGPGRDRQQPGAQVAVAGQRVRDRAAGRSRPAARAAPSTHQRLSAEWAKLLTPCDRREPRTEPRLAARRQPSRRRGGSGIATPRTPSGNPVRRARALCDELGGRSQRSLRRQQPDGRNQASPKAIDPTVGMPTATVPPAADEHGPSRGIGEQRDQQPGRQRRIGAPPRPRRPAPGGPASSSPQRVPARRAGCRARRPAPRRSPSRPPALTRSSPPTVFWTLKTRPVHRARRRRSVLDAFRRIRSQRLETVIVQAST